MEFADPLNSPYPMPWDWIVRTQAEVSAGLLVGSAQTYGLGGSAFHQPSQPYSHEQVQHQGSSRFQWTPRLCSPDGRYVAYSLIRLYAVPQLFRCWVNSVCFLEDLRARTVQCLSANSPLAQEMALESHCLPQPGAIAIFQPAVWNESGDRLLIRVFEGFFCSSEVTDYGVLWESRNKQTQTIVPKVLGGQAAVLLGWDPNIPEHILFRVEDFESSDPQSVSLPIWGD